MFLMLFWSKSPQGTIIASSYDDHHIRMKLLKICWRVRQSCNGMELEEEERNRAWRETGSHDHTSSTQALWQCLELFDKWTNLKSFFDKFLKCLKNCSRAAGKTCSHLTSRRTPGSLAIPWKMMDWKTQKRWQEIDSVPACNWALKQFSQSS